MKIGRIKFGELGALTEETIQAAKHTHTHTREKEGRARGVYISVKVMR
jgi:hypothetical protein